MFNAYKTVDVEEDAILFLAEVTMADP